ncbi:MAG TPA: chemotaxis protein CheA [Anaerovoracaceae bacterium]|nr:chemotaxis protein CheA [Anaerovoracaceae bacterium]
MDNGFSNEPMLDIYIYETTQNIEQIEKAVLSSERAGSFTSDAVNDIFRNMHTIKGSSAMMLFNNVASLTHTVEDLFYFIREEKPGGIDCALLSDIVLEGVDFIKVELEKVKGSRSLDGNPAALVEKISGFLASLKGEKDGPTAAKRGKAGKEKKEIPEIQRYYLSHDKGAENAEPKDYQAVILFEDDCEMMNIRAYAVVHNLKEITESFSYFPEDIVEDNDSAEIIREQGFRILLRSDKSYQELHNFFAGIAFLKALELEELEGERLPGHYIPPRNMTALEPPVVKIPKILEQQQQENVPSFEIKTSHQSIISVDVTKLDKLMDLMGEMVIAEAMVTQNPELQALKLDSFYKAARQLRKITNEMQGMVMAIRMVPLTATFQKMHRIVRDMSRKLDKEVQLELIGEKTEVDKNIIEHISDPLMHLVRNSVDHGIESPKERAAAGKPKAGRVTLEAKNAGSDVLVIIRDDGRGLSRETILQKAVRQGLLTKPENEMTEKEINNLIFLPGFSTNDSVTEFSGRGVGMDVVTKNLEAVGGSVSVESVEGEGTVTTLKIPLTLAIIDGMLIRVGAVSYTLPTISIRETFRTKAGDIIRDPDGNEMILVRGECYPVLRLHELYRVKTEITDIHKGIMLMVEQDDKSLCLFADELVGQQQVVVKALPDYIRNTDKIDGLAGCTLLGDGSISLILNIGTLVNM